MKINIILQIYDKPFHYDPMGQFIFYRNSKMVATVRGWGELQKLKKGEEIQDQIGEEIVKLLNNL